MKRCALTRRTPLRRKTRLRAASPRRARALHTYYRLRKEFLPLHPVCEIWPRLEAAGISGREVTCGRNSNQIHHVFRRGPHLLDTGTWLAACPRCHHWVETHANEARRIGLLYGR